MAFSPTHREHRPMCTLDKALVCNSVHQDSITETGDAARSLQCHVCNQRRDPCLQAANGYPFRTLSQTLAWPLRRHESAVHVFGTSDRPDVSPLHNILHNNATTQPRSRLLLARGGPRSRLLGRRWRQGGSSEDPTIRISDLPLARNDVDVSHVKSRQISRIIQQGKCNITSFLHTNQSLGHMSLLRCPLT